MSKSRLIRVLIANAFEIHLTIQIFYHCLYNNGMIIDNNQKKKKRKDVWIIIGVVVYKISFI